MSELNALNRRYSPADGTGQQAMPRNQKLTKVIAVRKIEAVTTEPESVLVLFNDQSSMKIKTVGAAAVSPGSKVNSVHEAKADFKIEFEDGSSATLSLAAPGPVHCRPRQE
jgi:hypothetical protein